MGCSPRRRSRRDPRATAVTSGLARSRRDLATWYYSGVDRKDFEALRDIPGKVIKTDIRLVPRRQTQPAMVADNIEIENSSGTVLKLNISYNPEVGSKTFNVTAVGIGPICRIDVDGTAHWPAGRSHKHSLQTERCPIATCPTTWSIDLISPGRR